MSNLARDYEVEIVNLGVGTLVLKDRSGGFIILNSYGDSDFVTLSDLLFMKNNLRMVFDAGLVGIVDENYEQILKQMRMEKEYLGTLLPEEFEKLIKTRSPKKLKETLETFSDLKVKTLCQTASLHAKDGKLDSSTVRNAFIDASGIETLFDEN